MIILRRLNVEITNSRYLLHIRYYLRYKCRNQDNDTKIQIGYVSLFNRIENRWLYC